MCKDTRTSPLVSCTNMGRATLQDVQHDVQMHMKDIQVQQHTEQHAHEDKQHSTHSSPRFLTQQNTRATTTHVTERCTACSTIPEPYYRATYVVVDVRVSRRLPLVTRINGTINALR